MDQFVCVRIVQANALDLTLFQFDFDLTFAVFLLNADDTIYGRYGTRTSQAAANDVSIAGLRKAMEGALALHKKYPDNKTALAAKTGPPPKHLVPEEYPSLKKFDAKLDYAGKVVASCIHCHQVRDAERQLYRQDGRAAQMPESLLFPYPMPDVIGLTLDPNERAKIKSIAADSPAAKAGFKAGDEILTLGGQPLVSIADVQWVLHHANAPGKLPARVRRDGKLVSIDVTLPADFRSSGDISWRPTTWPLRAQVLGGMRLEELPDEERQRLKLPTDKLALRAKHVGQYGIHAAAMRAGVKKDDVLVSYDGDSRRRSESELMAEAVRGKRVGQQVEIEVLRGDRRIKTKLPIQ